MLIALSRRTPCSAHLLSRLAIPQGKSGLLSDSSPSRPGKSDRLGGQEGKEARRQEAIGDGQHCLLDRHARQRVSIRWVGFGAGGYNFSMLYRAIIKLQPLPTDQRVGALLPMAFARFTLVEMISPTSMAGSGGSKCVVHALRATANDVASYAACSGARESFSSTWRLSV
jgi:hypothetical protein